MKATEFLLNAIKKEKENGKRGESFGFILQTMEAYHKSKVNESAVDNDYLLNSIYKEFGTGNGSWIAFKAIGMYKNQLLK